MATSSSGVLTSAQKRIALVAHDNMKPQMLEWSMHHRAELSNHILVGTGTTGRIIHEHTGLDIERLRSGPLGGDQQLGARIADGLVDVLLFFGTHWNPSLTTPISRRYCALLRSGTSPWRVTHQLPTTSCRHQ